MENSTTYRVACLPGDGIGPEVMREALRVLDAVASASGFGVTTEEHLVGGAALDETGQPLPQATKEACQSADAVLLGAVGGPKWRNATGDRRPESGLLDLRKTLSVYANLRPVRVPDALTSASPLRSERVAGTDILFVRELTGGIYFGEPRGTDNGRAFNTMTYSDEEIARIARVAFEKAQQRQGRVASVDKANVLEVSELWRSIVSDVQETEYPDVELSHYYVDNAAMQVVRDPRQFDVVLTSNLFGDILSDLAAALPGSLGLLPSASVGGGIGLFEPVHGSAPNIAGENVANPIATILSAALLLEELGEHDGATAIRQGVDDALDAGMRTADLAPSAVAASTSELGAAIAERAVATLSTHTPRS